MQLLPILDSNILFNDPGQRVNPERPLILGCRKEIEQSISALHREFEGPALASNLDTRLLFLLIGH